MSLIPVAPFIRSTPASLFDTLTAFPCMSLIPVAPFLSDRNATVLHSAVAAATATTALRVRYGSRQFAPTDAQIAGPVYLALVFLSSRGRGLVSSLDCVLLGHVFALPRRAVKTRACPVVNTCLGVHPRLAVALVLRARDGRFADRPRCRRLACGRSRWWRCHGVMWSGLLLWLTRRRLG